MLNLYHLINVIVQFSTTMFPSSAVQIAYIFKIVAFLVVLRQIKYVYDAHASHISHTYTIIQALYTYIYYANNKE